MSTSAKPRRWRYESKNIVGNLHDAAKWVSERHPEWDVVSFSCPVSASLTIVVHRIPLLDEPAAPASVVPLAAFNEAVADAGRWKRQTQKAWAAFDEAIKELRQHVDECERAGHEVSSRVTLAIAKLEDGQ